MVSLKKLLLLLCMTSQCIAMGEYFKLNKKESKKDKKRSNSISSPQNSSARSLAQPIPSATPVPTTHSAPSSPVSKHIPITSITVTEVVPIPAAASPTAPPPTSTTPPEIAPIPPQPAPTQTPLPPKKKVYMPDYPRCAYEAYRYNDLKACKEQLEKIPDDYFEKLPAEKQSESLFVAGFTASKLNDFSLAQTYLVQAILKKHTEAHYIYGKFCYKKQKHKLASEHLLNYLQLYKENYANQDEKTQKRLTNAEFLVAQTYYHQLVLPGLQKAAAEGSVKANFELAQYYEGTEKFTEAIMCYQQAQQQGKDARKDSSNYSIAHTAAWREEKLKRRIKQSSEA